MFGGMSDHTKVPVRDLGPDGKLTAEPHRRKVLQRPVCRLGHRVPRATNDGRQPFFAYVAFTALHDPRGSLPLPLEPYYRDLPPLPANFLAAASV